MKNKLFNKGDLKYIILDLLKVKPRYGYEIMRHLEGLSHGFYVPSPGSIYPTLQMLEENGYVVAAKSDGKKIYTITEEGNGFIDERKDIADEIKIQFTHYWNPDNRAEIAKTMDELGKFNHLFGKQLLRLDSGSMHKIRKIICRACEDIEEILDVQR